MILKCQCCGTEQEFKDGEAAFEAGWDAPPHFSTHVCCNICPAVCVVLGKSHRQAHAHWERHGRPEIFNRFCVIDDAWGITKDELDKQNEGVKAFIDRIVKGDSIQ